MVDEEKRLVRRLQTELEVTHTHNTHQAVLKPRKQIPGSKLLIILFILNKLYSKLENRFLVANY